MSTALLPPPADLGAPAKFTTWRDYQDQAIFDAAQTDARFVMQVLPTGAGKSLIYTMLAKLLGKRALILTYTKALQDQLRDEFVSMGMVSIKGRNAYLCDALRPGGEHFDHRDKTRDYQGCDEGPCVSGVRCSLRSGGCRYFDTMREAGKAELVITNYSKWMHEGANPDGEGMMGQFDLLILDEAHSAPDALSEYLTVTIEPWEISRIGAGFLSGQAAADQWRAWGGHHLAQVTQRVESLKAEIKHKQDNQDPVPAAAVREVRELVKVQRKLAVVAKVDTGWVIRPAETGKGGWAFTPVWPAPFAERALFRDTPKVLLVSATVRPKTAGFLGIKTEQLQVNEYPSVFAASRRPVYYIPTAAMKNAMHPADQKVWLSRIDQILKARADRKGIIHTVSYARAKLIHEHSEFRDRLIVHSSEGTRAAIARFKAAGPGAVLVSPAVTTGYDFPFDECEFQIIAKIPFATLTDPVLKARSNIDPEYGIYQTLQTLVQSAGRGMRAADDCCETFVIDDQLRWSLWRNKHLVPRWFLDTVQTRNVLPAPPPRLQVARRG